MKALNNSMPHSHKVISFKARVPVKSALSSRVAAAVLMTLMTPLFFINVLTALINRDKILLVDKQQDALGRTVVLHTFSHGLWRKSAVLFDIARGNLGFSGVPLTHSLTREQQRTIRDRFTVAPGVFSLFDLHKSSGVVVDDVEQLLLQQLNATSMQRAALIFKSMVCACLYSHKNTENDSPQHINLFGLNVANSTMLEAVNWITAAKGQDTPNVGFYINAHSINLGFTQPKFHQQLQQADALFADGSGMRLAAKHAGHQLKDNNNGTDMLPHLCTSCIKKKKSIYLLGAQQGVAMKAAINLKKQYPELQIVGVQHGFIDQDNVDTVITQINNSDCDILLVAMGSPMQESWILEHRSALKCQTALAVGGLFDFYAGEISRAPMWLREIGLEWIWRLIQEPKAKFYRYVVGNPIFLFRIYFLGLASKGEK